MLNIVIPLAGVGSRFLREGYWRPKPFVKALGKELVVWLIENLALCSMDTVVLIFNRNELKNAKCVLLGVSSRRLRRERRTRLARSAACVTP
jgi:choline kinase